MVGPRSSPDKGLPIMQGRARVRESEIGLELTWDARHSTSMETKELKDQVTDGLEIYLATE